MSLARSLRSEDYRKLIKDLRSQPDVQTAYITNPTTRPVVIKTGNLKPRQLILTPNFDSRQGYLRNASLGGIDADFAATVPGGRGQGIQVIDVEGAWLQSHENLLDHFPNTLGLNNLEVPGDLAYGTAVAGVVGGDRNNLGITGIVAYATFYGSFDIFLGIPSVLSSARAIIAAAAIARRGWANVQPFCVARVLGLISLRGFRGFPAHSC